jgi:hypothetical protein
LPHAKISGPQGGVKRLLFGCERPKSECFNVPRMGTEHALRVPYQSQVDYSVKLTPRQVPVCVCVFIPAGPITKLFAGGGGGEWTTCAMIDDVGPVRNPVL